MVVQMIVDSRFGEGRCFGPAQWFSVDIFVSFLSDCVDCMWWGWGNVREKTYESIWRCVLVRRCALVRSFACSSSGWLVDSWLVRFFVVSLVRWLVGWFVGWLHDGLVGSMVGVLVGWFVGWVGWLVRSCVRWFVRSLLRSFARSFVRSLGRAAVPFVRPSVHPSRRAFVHFFFPSFARTFALSFARSCLRSSFFSVLPVFAVSLGVWRWREGNEDLSGSESLSKVAHGPQSNNSTSANRVGETVHPNAPERYFEKRASTCF